MNNSCAAMRPKRTFIHLRICGLNGGKGEKMTIPRRQEILEVLRHHKEELASNYGVTKLGVFGSVARDEAREESDVDVVVSLRQPNLFMMVHIKEALEEALQRPVDIVQYREQMNQFLKQRIDREAVYV
jgi:uncharacterized protein